MGDRRRRWAVIAGIPGDRPGMVERPGWRHFSPKRRWWKWRSDRAGLQATAAGWACSSAQPQGAQFLVDVGTEVVEEVAAMNEARGL
mgnify:CR=1 FL=1